MWGGGNIKGGWRREGQVCRKVWRGRTEEQGVWFDRVTTPEVPARCMEEEGRKGRGRERRERRMEDREESMLQGEKKRGILTDGIDSCFNSFLTEFCFPVASC